MKQFTLILLGLLAQSYCYGQSDSLKIINLKEDVAKHSKEIIELEVTLEKRNNEVSSLKKESERLSQSNSDYILDKQNLEGVGKELEIKIEGLRKIKSQLDLKVAQLESDLISIRQEKNKIEIDLKKDNANALEQLEKEKLRLAEEQTSKRTILNQLKIKNKNIKALDTKNLSLNSQYQQARKKSEELKSSIKNLTSVADSLRLVQKRLLEQNASLTKSENNYRTVIMIALSLMVAAITFFVILSFNSNRKPSKEEQRKLEKIENGILKNTLKEYFYLTKTVSRLRHMLFGTLLLTSAFIVSLLIFSMADDGFKIKDLVSNDFWEVIGGLSAPLIFSITLYANAESKKNEVAKFLVEQNVSC